MDEWQNIGTDKWIKTIEDGKIAVVSPCDVNTIVPIFCFCCEFPMKTAEDSISFRNHGVCNHCDNRWTNKQGVEWPNGPDKSSEEWKSYIETRTKMSKPIIFFK